MISVALDHNVWVAAVGAGLIEMVWQAAMVGAILGLARVATRRASARVRYALSCVALFSLPAILATTILWAHDGGVSWNTTGLSWLTARLHASLPVLVVVWAIGVAIMAAYSLGGWVMVQRLRHAATVEVPAAWVETVARLAKRMRVRGEIALRLSRTVASPCVMGCWRPMILLPLEVLTAVPADQLEALLAHELAHVRRWDYIVNLAQRGVEVILFFHPAVWWISARVSEERENCCDDLAIAAHGDRFVYARALLNLAQAAAPAATAKLACGAGGGSLGQRVRRVLGTHESIRVRMPKAMPLVIASLVGVCAVASLAAGIRTYRAAPPASSGLTAEIGERGAGARAISAAPIVRVSPQPVRLALRTRPRPEPALKAAAGPAVAAPRQRQRSANIQVAVNQKQPKQVWVTVSMARFESCTPQIDLAPVETPAGRMWIETGAHWQCVPVTAPVRVWVGM